jgi:hypothetical protein
MTVPTFEVANAHFVTDFLAVGGDLAYDNETAAKQAIELVELDITHVLDVRQECDDAELWSYVPEVTYRWDGIDDAGQSVLGEWFEGIFTWAVDALEDPAARLLTHCHMGINRGPSAGFAVLLGLGWAPVAALEAIRKARPIAAIAYAEDALAWHLDRIDATPEQREETLAQVRDWFVRNPIDVVRIIRKIRVEEAS